MAAESLTLAFLQSHGYWILFLLMLLDGSIVALAGFVASVGIFKVWIIFILAFFAGAIPDSFWFFLGKIGRKNILEKYFSEKMKKAEDSKIRQALRENYVKALFAIKFTPYIQIPGFILAGTSKLEYEKFLPVSVTINLVSALVFTFGGYFFGKAFISIWGDKIRYIGLVIIVSLILIVIIIRLYKKFHKWTYKKLMELANNRKNKK